MYRLGSMQNILKCAGVGKKAFFSFKSLNKAKQIRFLCLSEGLEKMPKKPVLLSTIVFMDLETTGLPRNGFKPEITELCLLGVSRFAIEESDKNLRVQNKLTICCHPQRDIQREAASLSGLNRINLFHQRRFDSTAVDLIQSFIARLDPPICIVAHNGYGFDFPLLRTELAGVRGYEFKLFDHTGSPILCSDSVPMFKKLADSLRCSQAATKDDSGFEPSSDRSFSDSEQPLAHSSPRKDFPQSGEKESFRLTDVYSRVFGSVQTHAHSAEGDCLAMMELLQYLGIPAIEWLQENYTDFNNIRYMYPPVHRPTVTESENRFLLGETACQLEGMRLD